MIIPLFLLELFALFYFSKQLSKSLSRLFFRITKSKKLTITLLALLFFPGVVIHELAHLIVANLLLVKTGEIEFLPVMNGNEVKLGSVAIAKTDPIRRFLIGAAPILVGIALIAGSFVFLELNELNALWKQILFVYILFVIGNTMYSSKKDMEGALELFGTIFFIALVLYLVGVRIESIPTFLVNEQLLNLLQQINQFLLVPLGLDLGVIGLTKMLLRSQM